MVALISFQMMNFKHPVARNKKNLMENETLNYKICYKNKNITLKQFDVVVNYMFTKLNSEIMKMFRHTQTHTPLPKTMLVAAF